MDDAPVPTQGNSLIARKAAVKTWLHRIGMALGLAGVLFVAVRLYAFRGELDMGSFTAGRAAAMAGLSVVYAASNVLLALAWQRLLSALGTPVATRWALWAYAVSQLAKYVPGNVFQFAGRQALGLAAGLDGWSLAKSTAWELVFLTGCGALFALLVLPTLGVSVSATWAGLLLVLAVGLLAAAVGRLWAPQAACALLFHAAFLALSGCVFAGAAALVEADVPLGGGSPTLLVGAYVVAWLAGLLTPGAPAGLGVREAVLLFLLGQGPGAPAVLLAVLLARAITVTGDLLFYSSSFATRGPITATRTIVP